MSPELVSMIYQVSRYLFAFLGVIAVLSALGWLHTENKAYRERLRSIPSAGTVGELLVLSGSDELPAQTWFPVTREGVLGSVRSCDVVVPCPGVRAHHLDYCWKDGVGLLIYPRSGCEVLIDGTKLNCRSDPLSYPLTHGACMQVGQAVLRLQLLKALDISYEAKDGIISGYSSVFPESGAPAVPSFNSVKAGFPYVSEGQAPVFPTHQNPALYPETHSSGFVQDVNPTFPGGSPCPASVPVEPERTGSVSDVPLQRRRSEIWKEEWSE